MKTAVLSCFRAIKRALHWWDALHQKVRRENKRPRAYDPFFDDPGAG